MSKQVGFVIPEVIVAVVIIGVLTSAIWLRSQVGSLEDLKEYTMYWLNIPTPTLTPVVYPTPNPTNTPTPSPVIEVIDRYQFGEFKKRHFDPQEEYLSAINYPQEMLAVAENNLVGVSCSSVYRVIDETLRLEEQGEFGRVAKVTFLEDKTLLGLYNEAQATIEEKIKRITFCETENKESILVYEVDTDKLPDSINIAYFGMKKVGGKLEKRAEITKHIIPYFTCTQPFQLTKGGIFYLECRGGDIGGYGFSIYKIDLNKSVVRPLVNCSRFPQAETAEGPSNLITECKIP